MVEAKEEERVDSNQYFYQALGENDEAFCFVYDFTYY